MRDNYKITGIIALMIIVLTANIALAQFQWDNNITVGEYGMSWSYSETLTGIDSITYRIGLDENIGNNDGFINAWELLLADKEVRKNLKNAIDTEPDARIDNSSERIEVIDIDAVLSTEIIGKTMLANTIVNRYIVTYGFENSIMNATSIWFMGGPESPVTIIMPAGIDVVNISGMDNVTKKTTDHTKITGIFSEKPEQRGEITLGLARNQTRNVSYPVINETTSNTNKTEEKITKPIIERLYETLFGIKNTSLG
ncbi:MAG: hypothetical protein SCH70_12350 [Candidatus Methanoperedens sp.]|nr:hypothetical protein [Candidatus Methanoperedens sp.]